MPAHEAHEGVEVPRELAAPRKAQVRSPPGEVRVVEDEAETVQRLAAVLRLGDSGAEPEEDDVGSVRLGERQLEDPVADVEVAPRRPHVMAVVAVR